MHVFFGLISGHMAEEHKSVSRARTRSTDGEDISLIRSMINDLKEEKDELKKSNQFLLQELQKKQKLLSELKAQVWCQMKLKTEILEKQIGTFLFFSFFLFRVFFFNQGFKF